MTTIERFYVPILSRDDTEAIGVGLAWLQDRSRRDQAAQAVLATYSKQVILHGSLASALGDRLAGALYRKAPVAIGNSQLILWTKKTAKRPYLAHPAPVLCVYVDDEQLNSIDAAQNVSAICLVFSPDFNVEWVRTWNPINVRTMSADQQPESLPSRTVQQALISISDTINRLTGPLGHPSDRAACIWAFRKLKKARVLYDPDEIRRFLVVHLAWSPASANQLRDIAKGVLEGKRFKAGTERWASDIVQRWKRQAAQSGGDDPQTS